MTAVWGPLGWITLHSISVNYPTNPQREDKVIVKKFLDLFAETISCPSCKGHFTNMYQSYTRQNPTWADSKYNLFLFIVRAHNTVNKRIDKPRPATVAEALNMLRRATQLKTPAEYRASYITYLTNNWARQGGGEGFIQMSYVREMKKINDQYWSARESGFSMTFPEADVLLVLTNVPSYMLPFTKPNVPGQQNVQPNLGLKLRGGRFSFGLR